MSYDVFVSRFVNGESVALDEGVAREVLAPHVVVQDGNFLQVKVGSGQGGADVYFSSDANITINHVEGDEAMDLVGELVRRLGACLVLPGGTVILNRGEDREHLPEGFKDGWTVTLASTGAEITRVIQAS